MNTIPPPAVQLTTTVRPPIPTTPAITGHGDPCTLVILGATGDLSRRKLIPAIYDLVKSNLLDERFAVLAVDRIPMDHEAFRHLTHNALQASDEIHTVDPATWSRLSSKLFYTGGDLTQSALYEAVGHALETIEGKIPREAANRLFYLAVPPSIFEPIVKHLSASQLVPKTDDSAARPWRRVVIEKPFGHDLATAQSLNKLVLSVFAEHQVYRIDHYLGKETVQNLLVFRSINAVFEPIWNQQHVAHVQITAAETVGVEARGKYYEEAGTVRDMFQNHLLQLLALTAMDLPCAMTATDMRNEKVKVLRAVRPFIADGGESAVRAQYTTGTIRGSAVPGYREEPNVSRTSVTPTYAMLRVMVDNHRWKGVPFYLRSGKRMAKRVSEIAIQFHRPPHQIFECGVGYTPQPNVLALRLQPNEGISFRFEVKIPGAALALTPEIEVCPVDMNFNYADAFGADASPAYKTLLLDCMIGDATLFTRSDEVEAAWRLTDPLLEHWSKHPPKDLPTYAAGTWGPPIADEILARDGFSWRTP